jgi:hypothetical protein
VCGLSDVDKELYNTSKTAPLNLLCVLAAGFVSLETLGREQGLLLLPLLLILPFYSKESCLVSLEVVGLLLDPLQ